jgi:hypothetical protein
MYKVEVKSRVYLSNYVFITPNILGVCEIVKEKCNNKPEDSDITITITETDVKYFEI